MNPQLRCSSCGSVISEVGLGALIPGEYGGVKAYCVKCKIKGLDDYLDSLVDEV